MAMNKDMMHAQTHSLFEKAGEVLEGVAKLKERIAELERDNHAQKIALEDAYRHVAMIPSIRRALWLARANYCHNFRVDWYIGRNPHTPQVEKIMEHKMIISEMKCRAKAKEYK